MYQRRLKIVLNDTEVWSTDWYGDSLRTWKWDVSLDFSPFWTKYDYVIFHEHSYELSKEVVDKPGIKTQPGLQAVLEWKEIPFDKNNREHIRLLEGEKPEFIRQHLPNAVCVVDRSWKPDYVDGKYIYPWRRFGRRSYYWVVPLEDIDKDKGRRISTFRLFPDRKSALDCIYSKECSLQFE